LDEKGGGLSTFFHVYPIYDADKNNVMFLHSQESEVPLIEGAFYVVVLKRRVEKGLKECIELGIRIYRHRDTSDFNIQRFLVFLVRAFANNQEIKNLYLFFRQNADLREIEKENAIFYEQLTRHIFYHKSTIQERLNMIKQHFTFCLDIFKKDALQKIYYDQRLILWKTYYKDEVFTIGIDFKYVDRKEGLMSIELQLAEKRIYHITFCFCQDERQQPILKIGALQGIYNGAEIIHDLTKCFFGYRPKNLILYALRLFAQELQIQTIYAVSNAGFFTNTHVRVDRKLKSSLDAFWLEAGGEMTEDQRFFKVPLIEKRKDIEDVKSQKRNLYRKRYKLLDEIKDVFKENVYQYIK
jgi:uncharacterized protein